MSTYIFGDIQGCYVELQQLLERIDFNPDRDQLGFVGDLVNRGSDSLNVLRFLKNLRKPPFIVLGNHDLYLLILGYGLMPTDAYQHTLDEVMTAKDRVDLLDWLRQQHFVLEIADHTCMVHAGIPPQWSMTDAMKHAKELEQSLQGNQFENYLTELFGDKPAQWDNNLHGQDRLRYITNTFTRMRFCQQDGSLEFNYQTKQEVTDTSFKPWFEWRQDPPKQIILFGHWAMLKGQCPIENYYALDTGCAWGEKLTALRLEDKTLFQISATC